MSTEAMKLALGALENRNGHWGSSARELKERAITALQKALEQPQQEPVRVCNPIDCQYIDGFGKTDCDWCRPKACPPARKPLTPDLEADTGYSRDERAAFTAGWEAAEAAHDINENT